jgi:hypothetical protein
LEAVIGCEFRRTRNPYKLGYEVIAKDGFLCKVLEWARICVVFKAKGEIPGVGQVQAMSGDDEDFKCSLEKGMGGGSQPMAIRLENRYCP